MGIWHIVMETNRLSRPSGCPAGVSQPFQIVFERFPQERLENAHGRNFVKTKNAPEVSSWTQKMRLGILYNLYPKSCAKQIFRRSYGDLGVFDLVTQRN